LYCCIILLSLSKIVFVVQCNHCLCILACITLHLTVPTISVWLTMKSFVTLF